jgi:outer membrane protein assembly factor BamA
MKLGYTASPGIAGLQSQQTVDTDIRYYKRLASTGVFATRFRGYRSFGSFPSYTFFGGNSEMHGYDYYSFVGQNGVFADAELRFPIIEAALTPIGVIGGIRGVFFANIGGAWFDNQGFKFWTSSPANVNVITSFAANQFTGQINYDPFTGLPFSNSETRQVTGFRLQDGRASYGLGFETFALGFPIHFDWAWRTLFNKQYEDAIFSCTATTLFDPVSNTVGCTGGSSEFRKPRFDIWIGYDF